ncbi:diadenosine tetraphosphate hydrolase [Pedococcus sp. KACC 23699]|uniref:Diadenosine tetraphosphate hydrolase n=1 Tax=Pedococcus sp. KACC 23699 TaxID=3149228 RepID=A0AAU7JU68_9MICO
MTDWRRDRVGAALRGENPTVLRRLEAGFAVMGDVQFLPGYCVLVTDTPGVDRLTDLPRPRRIEFLADMELLGEAVQRVCARRDPGFRRINLEIQGNHDAFLHAHVWPRYEWEGPEHTWRPVALHPIERWRAPEPDTVLGPQHDDLRRELVAELDRLVQGLGPRLS